MTFSIPLLERAASSPDGIAVHAPSGDVTWAGMAGASGRIATRLRQSDLGPEHRVAVFAGNHPGTVAAHVGALLAGASVVGISSGLTAAEVAYQLVESRARLVFCDPGTEAVARAAVASAADDDAAAEIGVVVLPASGVRSDALDGWTGDDVQAPAAGDPVRPNLLFTSGTTGRPKAVTLPPATFGGATDMAGFVAHVAAGRMVLPGPHLVAGPLHHNGPLTAVRLLLVGVPLVVAPKFVASDVLAAIGRYQVATSVMVPTHFVRLLALPDEERAAADVSSLRCVVHTGAACPIRVKQAVLDWWGPVLYESYGATESGTTCSIGPEDWLAHPGSVGRPVPPFEALVVDEDGNPMPAGEEGRLYFRDTSGRGIRYEGDDDKTAAAHLQPGVFTLGEIGRIDEDGFVYITDRFSDMVVSGGVNLYPAEIEQVLRRHADVADAACFGVEDPDFGERLEAAVELRSGATVTTAELADFCRSQLAGYKCPKVIHALDDLGRTPMGKLDKRALRDRFSPRPV